MNRIVSLIASATEIVCALGLEEQLVGRSHECDYPPSVRSLPICTSPKFPTDGTSYQIDQRVKAILQEALAVYRVDADLLYRLEPSHIITQTQCDVCAVSLEEVEQAVCRWTGSKPILVPLAPNALHDVWNDIQRVAAALSVPDRGDLLIRNLKERMSRIADRAGAVSNRPRVASIEWLDPLMAGGNWMPELIAMAGGTHLFGEAGKHSPRMTWEALKNADPDILMILPCGFDIDRTRNELGALIGRDGWPDLRAVQTGQVYLMDGNQYFNRPGPRLAESLEILAEIVHPELFHFGHERSGWQKYPDR